MISSYECHYMIVRGRENGALPGCLENDLPWSLAAISIAKVVFLNYGVWLRAAICDALVKGTDSFDAFLRLMKESGCFGNIVIMVELSDLSSKLLGVSTCQCGNVETEKSFKRVFSALLLKT